MKNVDLKSNKRRRKYDKIVTAGTFDRLHLGHLYLLTKAFKISKYVYIGITDDQMIKNKEKSNEIWDFKKRFTEILNFLKDQRNYRLFRINNPYGFTLKFKDLDAILVSKETENTGKKINKRRKEKGFPKLKIETIEMIKSEKGNRISSTKIRKNKIDREGKLKLKRFM